MAGAIGRHGHWPHFAIWPGNWPSGQAGRQAARNSQQARNYQAGSIYVPAIGTPKVAIGNPAAKAANWQRNFAHQGKGRRNGGGQFNGGGQRQQLLAGGQHRQGGKARRAAGNCAGQAINWPEGGRRHSRREATGKPFNGGELGLLARGKQGEWRATGPKAGAMHCQQFGNYCSRRQLGSITNGAQAPNSSPGNSGRPCGRRSNLARQLGQQGRQAHPLGAQFGNCGAQAGGPNHLQLARVGTGNCNLGAIV
ncbi:unnamed protein product [Dicrocoelium dendriticum]|nr:unnamed protein product [Dicrocoelium dendriticum]